MSGNFDVVPCGKLDTANDLLVEALEKLRECVICDIESACILVRIPGEHEDTFAPEPGSIDVDGRLLIEEQIELIRKIELHLGNVPFIGPQWFDDMVARRGDWEGGLK